VNRACRYWADAKACRFDEAFAGVVYLRDQSGQAGEGRGGAARGQDDGNDQCDNCAGKYQDGSERKSHPEARSPLR
jgi:hypothetical protein